MRPSRFDTWIHDSFRLTPEALGLYRMFFGSYALLVVAPGHDLYASLTAVATLPATMFLPPPGPMMAFGGFPSPLMAEILHLGINLSLVALTLGYRTRLASVATGALLLLLYGFSYSLGKINHNMLFVILPLLMSFSNWGAALSFDASRRPSSRPIETWPITMLSVLVGFAMFTAGFAKILGGWLDVETQAAFGHLVKHYLVRGRTDLLAPLLIDLKSALIWETFDYATVALEAGFLLAAFRPAWVRAFAGLAVLFHFGVMLTLNIAFAFNLAVYAAFIDWDAVLRAVARIAKRVRISWRPRPEAAAALPFLALLGVIFYWAGSPLLWLDRLELLSSDLEFREVIIVSTAALLVSFFGIRVAYTWLLDRLQSQAVAPSGHNG